MCDFCHLPGVTFGIGGDPAWRVAFTPMEAIATITVLAAMTCVLALVGILWQKAERADQAVETLMLRRRTLEVPHDTADSARARFKRSGT
jgi:hypothetical protein